MSAHSDSKIRLISWPTWLLSVGLGVLFIGERVVEAKQRMPLDLIGGALLLVALGGRAGRYFGARDAAHRRAEGWLLGSMVVSLLGVILYLFMDLRGASLKESMGKGYDRLEGLVAVLWPGLLLLGGLALVNMQRSLVSMTDDQGLAEHVELQRVRYSAQSGATVAMVLMFCFAVSYVAADRNKKYDMARFRSTRPSPATKKLAENLNKKIKVTLFFQRPNEVLEQVEPYFTELKGLSGRLDYEVLDHALSPTRAKELSATGNGVLVLAVIDEKDNKVSQRESLYLGSTLEAAGTALGTFDGDVQKRLLTLTRPGRIAYFTTGHGERSFDAQPVDMTKDDLRAPLSDLRELITRQGFEVRTLGAAQGLLNKIPGDAGIVFVAGPTEKFLPEEVGALKDFLQGGGHMYVILDPSAEAPARDLGDLLKSVGMKYNPQILCNGEAFAVRTHKAADHANIALTGFSSHASVTTLSRVAGRAAVIAPRTGWFDRDGAAPAGVTLDFTIRTMPNTWADLNGDFNNDPNERKQMYDVAGVAFKSVGDAKDKKEMRLAVLGSVDAVSDLVLRNQANLVMFLDTVKWLMGDEALAAEVAQETDAPIVHTNAQDKLWFYSTIFAAPILILVGGLLYTRRVMRRRPS